MKALLLAALFLCRPALQAAAGPARKIGLVIDVRDRAERDLFLGLLQIYRARERVLSYELTDRERFDPIAKGKLLSSMANCDLVVAVGNGATRFAVEELVNEPIYFVNATVVPGRSLGEARVSGLFGYSVDDLLDAVKALRLGAVGIAFTPGYEPVAEWIRAGAAARGVPFISRRIRSPKEVSSAVGALLGGAKVIWLVGDPLLVRGAGFEFIEEHAISAGVPIVGTGRRDVSHGALLGSAPDPAAQESAAVRGIDAALNVRGAAPRLSPAVRGVILLNAALAARWNLRTPAGPRWRRIR